MDYWTEQAGGALIGSRVWHRSPRTMSVCRDWARLGVTNWKWYTLDVLPDLAGNNADISLDKQNNYFWTKGQMLV